MKFSCSKKDLLATLSTASKALAVRPMTPILAGFYLKVFGDVLEVQANNYSLGIAGQTPVNSQDEGGEVVVIGKKFLEVVRAMPDDVIFISQNDNYLEICSGRSNYSVATFKAADFPKVTTPDTSNRFKINASALKSAIKRTVFACSKDEGHPLYTGCLFDIDGEKISVAATDMHRLAVVQDTFLNAAAPLKIVIPAAALNVIADMLPDDDAEIGVDYTEKALYFSLDDFLIQARLIEGNFPDYNRVIPAETKITAELLTDEFRNAVARLATISKGSDDNKILFVFSEDGLKMSAYSADFGEGEEFVSANVEGGELEIAFKGSYITDVLKHFKNDSCKFYLNGMYEPAIIREIDNKNFVYVVTPLRA